MQLPKIRINRFIKILIYSDFFVFSAFGLINPILAVFITQQIENATIEVAAFASSIFLVTKAVLQIPVARYIDRKRGERDDFYVMILGSFMWVLVPIFYSLSSQIWHVYFLQVLYGIGGALSYPAYYALFSRHLDGGKEGISWSLHDTLISLGMATTAATGGIIAQRLGFQIVFYLVAAVSLLGVLFLLFIYQQLYPPKPPTSLQPTTKPSSASRQSPSLKTDASVKTSVPPVSTGKKS